MLIRTLSLLMLTFAAIQAGKDVKPTYKRWVPNTNFGNPANWDAGRLPCRNDRAHFSTTAPPVFVQTNATLTELILPNSGVLILGRNTIMSFSTNHDNDVHCPGNDIAFNRTLPADWFDPNNWCFAEDARGECMTSQPAALVTGRIPGQFDEVIFPVQSSFLVDLGENVDVIVGRLSIAGKQYTTDTFSKLLEGPFWSKQFIGHGDNSTRVAITNQLCDDITGCASGNEAGLLLQRVCREESSKCANVTCHHPILPDGACCRICGAVIQLEYESGFNLAALRSFIFDKYPRKANETVEIIVSKMSDGTIHIILRETAGANAGAAMKVGEQLIDKLKADMRGEKKYKVSTITVKTSQGPTIAALTHAESRLSYSSIFGIVLSVITILVAIAVAMYCLIDTGRCRGVSRFTRFGSETGKTANLELQGSMALTQLHFPDFLEDDMQGISNPIYDVPDIETVEQHNNTMEPESLEPGTLDPSQITFVQNETVSFGNPMYGQESDQLDPTLKINLAFMPDNVDDDSLC